MYPNEDLKYIRMVAEWSDNGDADGQDYRRAMQAFERLDEWLTKGGDAPAAWCPDPVAQQAARALADKD